MGTTPWPRSRPSGRERGSPHGVLSGHLDEIRCKGRVCVPFRAAWRSRGRSDPPPSLQGLCQLPGRRVQGGLLAARVNNLLHWEAIRWARNKGCGRYRLGPVFPELPEGWPISRVSRFKGNLGAWPYHIIQGSLFLHPEKYEADGAAAITSLCSNRNGGVSIGSRFFRM
jgi:hypothetical protein